MSKSVRILASLAVVALLGWRVYVVVAARNTAPHRPSSSTAVPVVLAPVEHKTLRDVRILTGSLIPLSQFNLAPKVAGRLERLAVKISDPVHKGDLIAELDSQEYLQQVEQARAEREVARSQVLDTASALDVASNDFTRVRELLAQKVASEAEADQAKARFLAAQARHGVTLAGVRQAEAALKASEVRLSYTRITAGWDDPGDIRVIGEKFADEGAMLRANDPIVSVLDIQTVVAVLAVIERDYPRIQPGQAASVTTDAYPGETFPGRILRKAPLLKEGSRQARVELEIPNPDRKLAPGMFIRAAIELAAHPDVPAVPSSALVRRQDRLGVFVPDAARAKALFVPVTPGLVSGGDTELLPPAPEGPVVVLGQHLLQEGSALLVAPAAGSQDTRTP
jgi:RND family efflux transporter MFP subunit